MIGIVEDLILRSGLIDVSIRGLVVILDLFDLTSEIEYTRVGAFLNLPVKLEDEVVELVLKDDVATIALLSLATTVAIKFESTVLNCPFGRSMVLAIASPAIKVLTVEYLIITLSILGKSSEINLRSVDYDISRYAVVCWYLNLGRVGSSLLSLFRTTAGYYCNSCTGSYYCKCFFHFV